MSQSNTQKFTLAEMIELHKAQPALLFEYFVAEYCNKLLEASETLRKVEVVISDRMSYIYYKTKMQVVK